MIELTFDLETIPDQTPGALEQFIEEAKANFRAPSSMTKTEAVKDLQAIGKLTDEEAKAHSKESAIQLWEQTFAEENAAINGENEWRKTSFDGNRGELAVIGWKIGNGETKTVVRLSPAPEHEAVLLQDFYTKLAEDLKHESGDKLIKPKYIGHYIEGFDLPFLFKRSVIRGVKPCIDLKMSRYADNLFDTCGQWAGYGNRISLDKLCKVLGVPTPKDDLDGSKVWDYVMSGRIAEVAEYCKKDVEATYACYRKMTFAEVTAEA